MSVTSCCDISFLVPGRRIHMQQSSEHTATSETGFVKDQTGENRINLTLTVHVHESMSHSS